MDPEKTDASEIIIDITSTRVEPTEMPTEEVNNQEQIAPPIPPPTTPEQTQPIPQPEQRPPTPIPQPEQTPPTPIPTPEQTPPTPTPIPQPEQTQQTTEPTEKKQRRKKLSKAEKEEQEEIADKLDEQIKKEEEDKTKAEEIINDKELSDKKRTKAFAKMLNAEKKIESLKDKKTEIEDRIAGLEPIPKPMRKIMNQIFDEEYRVRTDNIAFEYATKEELYYKNATERRREQLRTAKGMNFTEDEIEAAITAESPIIRDMIQSSLKRKITNDIKNLTIDEIKSNPDKYKEFIDPNTGEVIESITKKNLTGKILAERVWPKWYPDHHSTTAIVPPVIPPTPEPIPESTPEPTQEKVKKEQPWLVKRLGLIGGVLGFGAAVTWGATAGGYAVIGGAAVAGLSLGISKLSEWRMSKLLDKLGEAKTPEEKANLEKRIKILNNIREVSKNTARLFRGIASGAVIGSGISALFMSGKGLTTILGAKSALPPTEAGLASPEATNPANNPQGQLSEPTTVSEPIPQGTIKEPISEAFTDSPTLQPPIVETPTLGNTFNSGLSYEQATQLGWGGPNLLLTEAGGFHGRMQGEFFNRIYQGLGSNVSSMQGFNAAQAYNPFLRAVVSGRMGVEEAAKGAIQAIQALP